MYLIELKLCVLVCVREREMCEQWALFISMNWINFPIFFIENKFVQFSYETIANIQIFVRLYIKGRKLKLNNRQKYWFNGTKWNNLWNSPHVFVKGTYQFSLISKYSIFHFTRNSWTNRIQLIYFVLVLTIHIYGV